MKKFFLPLLSLVLTALLAVGCGARPTGNSAPGSGTGGPGIP